eukprot:PhM_4_TR8771/c1_g1_i1/m.88960
MDDFKDVMLSELPVHSAPAFTSNLSSLENYKGILLCDRPTDARVSMGPQAAPFLPPGKVEERLLGLQPSMERRTAQDVAKTLRHERTKRVPPTALSRHKQFLRKLNEQVRTTQDEAVEALANKEEQRKKFQKMQEKQRQMLREAAEQQVRGDADQSGGEPPRQVALYSSVDPPAVPATPPKEEEQDAPRPASADAAPMVPKAPKSKKPATASASSKPTWAMTAEEAEDHEFEETQKLVEFAQGLDFDKFIDDYEVREALSIMRDRIQELAQGGEKRTGGSTTARDPETASTTASEADGSKPRRERGAGASALHEKGWDSSTSVADVVRNALNTDALVLAERILNKSEHLRQIYSKQAMARMLQDALVSSLQGAGGIGGEDLKLPQLKSRMENVADGLGSLGRIAGGVNPVVSTVSVEAQYGDANVPQKRILTELKKSKDHVQNLPYLYRCPSI